MADETMSNGKVYFRFDEDLGIRGGEICEEVQGEPYGSVGGVFEGDDAVRCGFCLDGGEDGFYGGEGEMGVF